MGASHSPKLSYAVKPGGLSAADHDQIFTLAEAGMKCGRIARKLLKHPATVRWFMYRNGLIEPSRRQTAMPIDRPNSAGRKGYCPAEDAFISRLRTEGVPLTEIAKRTTERFGHPRSRHGVEVRLVMLAARDDEATEAA
ncbi:hypothetical protein [Methylobacterium gnaphalii]|uniref:Uncharacterized protein n=1 Tax=Methylobacterium gnaphalii TaxID=1010610 RepID=A0A512JQY8_9HYPH|nr:hypothetical protein [Methylobacterium gnaphalii]GEP12283.1 hypothetical protein MGN01_41280 [Methylobacterium gnaphalii]GJD68713.1 hypothetical protein MMMDOFMJ_1637 [Methylobacterium gnaphalii]GLS49390.1 hypothetical protein GCM10007885_22380 [Methylobacterium gnaphalii]